MVHGNEVTPFRLGYKKKIILGIIWFTLKMHSVKYNTDLKKQNLILFPAVCLHRELSGQGVVRTGLSIERELVTHGTE